MTAKYQKGLSRRGREICKRSEEFIIGYTSFMHFFFLCAIKMITEARGRLPIAKNLEESSSWAQKDLITRSDVLIAKISPKPTVEKTVKTK